MSEEIKVTVLNTHKDRVFKIIFKEKKKLLNLYNALAGTDYTNEEELEINTLEDALYISMKNDLSFILDGRMSVFEQQSTLNPNMPLRGLFYIADLYKQKYSGVQLYSSKMLKIATPQYIVFYNGIDNFPEKRDLKLSDAFEHPTDTPDVEVVAHVININIGHNKELLSKCRELFEYSTFIERIRKNMKSDKTKEQAIQEAIESCIEDGILTDILKKEKVRIMASILAEFDEVGYAQMLRDEGREQGKEEGKNRINLLNQKLMEEGRLEDLMQSIQDKEYQQQLLKEYNM